MSDQETHGFWQEHPAEVAAVGAAAGLVGAVAGVASLAQGSPVAAWTIVLAVSLAVLVWAGWLGRDTWRRPLARTAYAISQMTYALAWRLSPRPRRQSAVCLMPPDEIEMTAGSGGGRADLCSGAGDMHVTKGFPQTLCARLPEAPCHPVSEECLVMWRGWPFPEEDNVLGEAQRREFARRFHLPEGKLVSTHISFTVDDVWVSLRVNGQVVDALPSGSTTDPAPHPIPVGYFRTGAVNEMRWVIENREGTTRGGRAETARDNPAGYSYRVSFEFE